MAARKERGSRISRRDAPIIEKLMVLFGSAPSSKFQYEGPARHCLRSQFCLHGSPWATADARAGALVAEALRLIGAERPTWQQAQPDYATPAEWYYCRNCGAPAAMGANGRLRKYCSDKCLTVFHASKGQRFGFKQRRADYLVAAAAKRAERSKQQRDCERCGSMFTPRWKLAQYCSQDCANAARSEACRTRPDRECVKCGSMFKPRSDEAKYCSRQCLFAAMRKRPDSVACATCTEPFQPADLGQRYCSRACYVGGRWGNPLRSFRCEAAE